MHEAEIQGRAFGGLKRRGGVYGGKGVPQSASGRARRAAGGDIRALFQPRGERGIFPEKLRRFCGRVPQHEGACAGVGDGQNYEMDAIGSCFIGGASAYGGIGTVPGVIVGAVLMGVINIGMSIMGVDANYQKVVKGLVLLAAVIFDVVSKREKT